MDQSCEQFRESTENGRIPARCPKEQGCRAEHVVTLTVEIIQTQPGDSSCYIDPRLRLQAERLQGDGLRGPADEDVSTPADGRCCLRTRPTVVPGKCPRADFARGDDRPGYLRLTREPEIHSNTGNAA